MNFDPEKARQNLERREKERREAREALRLEVLEKAKMVLLREFEGTPVKVYLVGSVTQSNQFRVDSDVDIVLKNFDGDRFDVWTRIESVLDRSVMVTRFEQSYSQEWYLRNGLRIV